MFRIFIFIFSLLVASVPAQGQSIKLTCSETEKSNEDGIDPIIIKTCLIKRYMFISTSYPDYAGRYVHTENKVFIKIKNKFVKTKNSKVFNDQQPKLLKLINERIQQDFEALKSDENAKECLSHIDSIPNYEMDDLQISFDREEIWFEVQWNLPGACRAVDGAIITFRIKDISKYFN